MITFKFDSNQTRSVENHIYVFYFCFLSLYVLLFISPKEGSLFIVYLSSNLLH